MANSYTTVGQIQQVNGENSTTWGDFTDINWDINNLLIAGFLSQAITSGDVTLADVDGTADAGKNCMIKTTGVLTGNRALIVPTKARRYIVWNTNTGAFTMTVKTAAGTGIAVPQGYMMLLMCDGTNVVEGLTAVVGGLNAFRPIISVSGTTKTLALTDANTRQECSNGSAQTVTIPPNSSVAFPVGTEIEFVQLGAGKVTLAQGVGVTISSISSYKSLGAQYAGATLYKQATDTWILIGNLIA